jgi:Rps23 Pro-64 3,4-dihydroxylase Tpa1-like proline 4-hydroxylase
MTQNEDLQKRIDDFYKIDEITWSSIEDLGSGIFLFRDVLPQSMNIIERLESVLNDSTNQYSYSEAMVGYGMKMPEYRDCYDFKYKKTDIQYDKSEASLKLQELWDDVYFRQLQAVKHYCKVHNIGELRYWEAMNYVKYGPGQHFQEHSDNGFSYNCVVSLVAYPNDNYEGGELYFRLQNLNIKPKAGDLFVFPSNFMYPHRAMPVHSGTKYSIVTMLDYSDKYHRPEFYRETGN